MAAINFPSSPQVNDTVVADEVTYIWDGEKWKANTYVPESVAEVLVTKQDTLVSGTNIKTINGTSLVGSGNATVSELSTENTSGIVSVTDDSTTVDATVATLPLSRTWRDIAYGNGKFVAVSTNNGIAVSTDGVNWTGNTTTTTGWWRIAYGNGLFVVANSTSTNQIITSPDGENWTVRTLPATSWAGSLVYDNNQFMLVNSNFVGRAFTSSDGITWTSNTMSAISYSSVAYGNGKWIATEAGGTRIATSTDNGATWALTTSLPALSSVVKLLYRNGLWIGVTNGNFFVTSTDGVTWTQRAVPSNCQSTWAAYSDNLIVAVGSQQFDSDKLLVSYDGISWHLRTLPLASRWNSVVYADNKFIVVGGLTTQSTSALILEEVALNTTTVDGDLNITGRLKFNSVNDISIPGGTTNTVLTSDGSGTLSWALPVPQLKTVNGNTLIGSGNIDISSPGASSFTRGLLFGASSEYSGQVVNSGNSGVGYNVTLGISGNNSTYGNSFVGNDISFAQGAYHSVAIGRQATIGFNSNFSTAVGYNTNIGQNNTAAIAIGASVQIPSNKGRAIGIGASPGGYDSINIGAATSGDYAVRIGMGGGYNAGSGNVILGYNVSDGNNQNVIAINTDTNTSLSASSSGFYVNAITSATASNVLYYDTTTKKITYGAPAGGGGNLEDLDNVSISNPTSGQVLKYNGTNWVNAADETGGGEEEPTTVITTTLLAPTQFGTYGSQDCYLAFNSTADRDYFVHVFNFLRNTASYYGNSGIFRIFANVNSTLYQIDVYSYSSYYTYGSLIDLYSVSYTNVGNGPPSSSISFSARVQATSLVDPTNLAITLASDSAINNAFSQLFVDSNLPYGIVAYPGNFAPSQIQAPSPSTPFGPPRTGTTLAATDSTIGQSGSYVLNNTNGFLSSSSFSQTSYAYIAFFLGKTTVTQSGGGGSTPAYTPSWFKLSANNPNNVVTNTPYTSPNLVPYANNQVPTPTDFTPPTLMSYSLRGIMVSLSPWGSNSGGWNDNFGMSTNSTTGEYNVFSYTSNPYNVPTNIQYYSYSSSSGAFALTFVTKNNSYRAWTSPNTTAWNSFGTGGSGQPATIPSTGYPETFSTFKMIFVSSYVPGDFKYTNFATSNGPFTPAHIDQVIVYDQNPGANFFVGLMTVTDPAVVASINSNGFTMTGPNGYSMRAFGWFEV